MTSRPLADDLRCLCAKHGLKATAAKVARKPLAALYSTGEHIVLAKDLDDVKPLAFAPTLRFEALEGRHLPGLAELNRQRCFTRETKRFVADLERGYAGMVALHGDELVGYYWWVDKDIDPVHRDIAERGLGIDLEDGDVYGFDFFILEQHRGGGSAVEFLHAVESGLRDRGYRRLWGYVEADNRPARWLYAMRGYRPVRTVSSRTVLARRAHRNDPHSSKETHRVRPIGMIDERRG